MRRALPIVLVLLATTAALAFTSRATYVTEATQAITRAPPVAATEGGPLYLTLATGHNGPAAASAVVGCVSTNTAQFPDAGYDGLNATGKLVAWRYSTAAGWNRWPAADCSVGTAYDAGSNAGQNTWCCPEQTVNVTGPSDRMLYAAAGLITGLGSTPVSQTTEVTYSETSQFR